MVTVCARVQPDLAMWREVCLQACAHGGSHASHRTDVCLLDHGRVHAAAGMKVGHQRSTQTRGVWLWSQLVPVDTTAQLQSPPAALHTNADSARDGTARHLTASPDPLNLLFFDTEGFESTGQSGAYDDRIFAFAAIISSTLVYNLAEAVRESDIEKLSFAVELAQAFYPQYQAPGCAICAVHLARPLLRIDYYAVTTSGTDFAALMALTDWMKH